MCSVSTISVCAVCVHQCSTCADVCVRARARALCFCSASAMCVRERERERETVCFVRMSACLCEVSLKDLHTG